MVYCARHRVTPPCAAHVSMEIGHCGSRFLFCSLFFVLCSLLPLGSPMNRTDRLLAIVLELQAVGRRRAEDLAATFEVGKRTVYRDIQALCAACVPIISTPGQGYTLLEGYFLPPLRFTADEALILLLGGDAMAQSFDAEYRAAAQSAERKIAGALPEALRAEVGSLRQSIRFVAEAAPGRRSESGLL